MIALAFRKTVVAAQFLSNLAQKLVTMRVAKVTHPDPGRIAPTTCGPHGHNRLIALRAFGD